MLFRTTRFVLWLLAPIFATACKLGILLAALATPLLVAECLSNTLPPTFGYYPTSCNKHL